MHARRNFGTMHHDWEDRGNKTTLKGFKVTFQDGYQKEYHCGLSFIPDADILVHGHVKTAKAIEAEP